ncbi:hypothetical protein Zmor_017816 [Zophobas morio]|uniref:Nose resistant-to-fluoxetine protein N-terminal domain-containing protein n=1 Tax=Zophobas morio TaxID=2755281 RepID=A0AA38IC53_9CUCU|nr:hypothetical protein Zmor_017816 [Zophobas morio]
MKVTIVFVLIAFITRISSLSLQQTIFLQLLKNNLLGILNNDNLDKNCVSDLNALFSDVSSFKHWALQMLDATGKIYPGLLNGNINLIGDYDECLAINESKNGRRISGKYCTLALTMGDSGISPLATSLKQGTSFKQSYLNHYTIFKFMQNTSMTWGICVPKSCSVRNLKILAHDVQAKFKLPVEIGLTENSCSYKNKTSTINNFDILVYYFFAMLGLILVASTIYDLHLKCFGKKSNIFVAFSLYSNARRLVSATSNKKEDNLSCLNGIKVLSCLWIVYGHVVLACFFYSKNPAYVVNEWKYSTKSTFTWSAFYAVDTFLTINGFLVTYIYLKSTDRLKITVTWFYLKRFLRVTPALLAAVLVHTSVMKLLTDGPFLSYNDEKFSQDCYNNWWAFFIHPIVFTSYEQCGPHLWYMFIEGHLYLCTPVFLIFMKKYPKDVLRGLSVILLLAVIYNISVTITKNIGFTAFEWSDDFENYFYFSTIYRLPCWLIGVLSGYFFYEYKFKIPRIVNLVIWVITLYTMIELTVEQNIFISSVYNVYRSALWNGLARPTWSLAVSFIVFSCATGTGGIVNDFLSHPVFRFLGELTYSIYLLHYDVILNVFGSTKEMFYFNTDNIVSKFLSVFVEILMVSVFLYLAFEAPVLSLKYHLTKNKTNEKRDCKKNLETAG